MKDPEKALDVKLNVHAILALKTMYTSIDRREQTLTPEFRARLAELNAVCARVFTGFEPPDKVATA
jgi:hypothetical protein